MRRVVSAASIAVLAGALWCGVASADPLPDLTSAFAQRTFGRIAPDAPHFSASAPSALRGLAFRTVTPVTLPPLARRIGLAIAAAPQVDYARLFDLHDVLDRYGRFVPATPAPIATAVAPPARFSLASASMDVPSYAGFAASPPDPTPAFASSLRDAATAYSPPALPAVRFTGSSEGGDLPAFGARDQRVQTVTSIAIGAPGRRVAFDLGSEYDRLSTRAIPTFQYRPGAIAKPSILDEPAIGGGARLAGGLNDVTTRGIDAGVAVPVARNLTLGMQYGTQRYTGAIGTTSFAPNLDTSKYSYVGNLTFALPRSSSSIVVSARQYRYQDNLTPATSSQTRADVNFTVKF